MLFLGGTYRFVKIDMWRILVFLTGSLGLYVVLLIIIAIGISVSSWKAWLFSGAFGLLFYCIGKSLSEGNKRSARRLRKIEKRKAKLERIKKAQMKREKAGKV